MALIDFQTVPGRMLREQKSDTHLRGVSLDERESRYFEKLRDTNEFRRGSYAELVRFYAHPDELLNAVQQHEPLPERPVVLTLFSPTLLDQGHSLTTLAGLLSHGAIEYGS